MSIYEQGPKEGDDKLYVKFYMNTVVNDTKSQEAGHPVFDDVPFVVIRAPGDKTTVIDTKVDGSHKARFPRQWQQFQANEEQTASGWAIRQWPAISRGQAEELAQLGIVTVEQLASMPDGNGSRIMGFNDLKRKAVTAMAMAKDTQAAQALATENAGLKTDVAALQQQVKELSEQMLRMNQGATNVKDSVGGSAGRRA